MRFVRFFLILMVLWTWAAPLHAAYDGEGQEGPYEEGKWDQPAWKRGGWFLGSEQGVLFFVGNNNQFANTQYYGNVFGGYNFKGWFSPVFRMGNGWGSIPTPIGSSSSYFFIFEGGIRATPLRTMVRPFFEGTAGVYILSFDNFGSPVQSEANFTYTGGGGLEVSFGRSNLTIGGEYRGFNNSGVSLTGVTITLGYYFQF